MKERGILFSAPMVRAILDGRKAQTRRLQKLPYLSYSAYQVGDRLWVREAADYYPGYRADSVAVTYHADNLEETIESAAALGMIRTWKRPAKNAMYMPRWASRITLEVTGVRCERLNDISEDDAKAEGAMWFDGRPVNHHGWRHDYEDLYPTAKISFRSLWCKIHGPESWAENPWVWVYEFTHYPMEREG